MNNRRNNLHNVLEGWPHRNPPLPTLDELPCPVCQVSLARHPNPQPDAIKGHGHQQTAMRNEIREMKAGKLKDTDLEVVGKTI